MLCSSNSGNEQSLTNSGFLKNALFIKHALFKHISEVYSAGSFTTFGTIKNFILPDISADSVGTVRLSLLKNDAHALIQTSCQTFFSKGTKILMNISVRKSWEIDTIKVQFLNKKWQCCLDQIVRKITKELGIDDRS